MISRSPSRTMDVFLFDIRSLRLLIMSQGLLTVGEACRLPCPAGVSTAVVADHPFCVPPKAIDRRSHHAIIERTTTAYFTIR
jgi:hypothetical protein